MTTRSISANVVQGGPTIVYLAAASGHAVAAGGNWQDVDLSGDMPKRAIAVVLCSSAGSCGLRPNGSALTPNFTTGGVGPWQILCPTDSNGILEAYWNGALAAQYDVIGYITGVAHIVN